MRPADQLPLTLQDVSYFVLLLLFNLLINPADGIIESESPLTPVTLSFLTELDHISAGGGLL